MMIESIKNQLANRQDLTPEELQFFLKAAFDGILTEAQKIEILSLMNSKGITGAELASAVTYLRRKHEPTDAIDVCGTGGSGLQRINTSTLAAFVLAAAGVKIAKHGNRGASGRCGSFDLLEKLEFKIDLTPEQSEAIFQQIGLAFFFAPKCYPEFATFGLARKAMKIPTMFNLMGPLLSPLNPKHQLIGTANEVNAKLILEACRLLGREKTYVVVGDGGLDEVAITGPSTIYKSIGETQKLAPTDFGIKQVEFSDIAGGSIEDNAAIARDFLQGKHPASAHADLIHANVALALELTGQENDLVKGVARSREIVRSGKALAMFESARELSQQV